MTRRSTRVRARIPLLISSLDPALPFSILSETMMVNAHGCLAKVPQPFEVGMPVRLRVPKSPPAKTADSGMLDGGSEATARVVICEPIGKGESAWVVGIELDTPRNLWGLTPSPEDWKPFETETESKPSAPVTPRAGLLLKMPVWPLASSSTKSAVPSRATQDEINKQFAAQLETIARLEQRLAAVESLPNALREQLSQAQQQMMVRVREQLSAALAQSVGQLQEELAICRKKTEDGQQIRAAVAEQLEQLPWQVQQHAEAVLQPLQESARAEIQRLIAEARPQHEQEAARLQALEASAQALQNELAQARAALESSMRELPDRIQEPIAAAVTEVLARSREEISATLAREKETLHDHGSRGADELRAAADLLRSEREETGAQLEAVEAKREELRQWLAGQQAVYTEQVKRQFEQLADQVAAHAEEVRQQLEVRARELAARSGGVLEGRFKSDLENQAAQAATDFKQRLDPMLERAESDLKQQLDPMLDRASALRQEVSSLLDTLQREGERCQTQARELLEQRDNANTWFGERTADFQKMFHDALVETTGQIRGRLQMAVEMIQQSVENLGSQAAQQLEEQAGKQTRLLHESADEAAERLRGLQREIESAVRESLRAQAAETAAACGREIAYVAQRSVNEWRSALARNLESMAGILGEQLPGGDKPEPK